MYLYSSFNLYLWNKTLLTLLYLVCYEEKKLKKKSLNIRICYKVVARVLYWLPKTNIQSALVISNSKGLWKTSRYPYFDISDFQNWGKKSNNQIFQIRMLFDSFTQDIYIKNYCGKGEKSLLKSNCSSYPQYFYPLVRFYVRTGTRISLRGKRLFEITEVEITRVDCIHVLQQSLIDNHLC